MTLELICEGLDFPEGPVAMADGSVIVCEIRGQRLTRVLPDGRKELVVETGGGPNGAAIGPDGAIWIANNGGAYFHEADYRGGYIQRFDLNTGALSTVYEGCEGERLITPNDLVFDRQGGLWFTDYGNATDKARLFGAVYYAAPGASAVSRQLGQLNSPNGVGLSPDEQTLYVNDTELGRLWAFDVVAPGQLAPSKALATGRVVSNSPGLERLDSLAVEAGGKVCAGTILRSGGGVTVIDPDGTREYIAVPDPYCTNICFGGADMRDAWVTASTTGRLYKMRWPRPGLRLNFNA